MKTQSILFTFVLLSFAFAAIAQDVEGDDMYFNSKDRAKLKEQQKKKELEYASSLQAYNSTNSKNESSNADNQIYNSFGRVELAFAFTLCQCEFAEEIFIDAPNNILTLIFKGMDVVDGVYQR